MQIRQNQGIEIKMPEVECPHLISWLNELGVVENGMNGISPLRHSEIESWINLSGLELTHWEVGMIRKLSAVYCSQYNKAKNPDCKEPFETEVDLSQMRRQAEQKIRNLF